MSAPIRIAMWSGPRNISTAMLRSFGNRADAWVSDEPLYAHYLAHTGRDHPGRDEIIACHEPDWRRVVAVLTGPVPGGKPVWYQKHMSHHLLAHIERDWLLGMRNAFLIRNPRRMLASLVRVLPDPGLEETGLPQQVSLFEWLRERTGETPPVVDSRDVLENPRAALESLCAALGIGFSDAMLEWPPGRRDTDGVWAKHWYDSVEHSTGFAPYAPKQVTLDSRFDALLAECESLYAKLYDARVHI